MPGDMLEHQERKVCSTSSASKKGAKCECIIHTSRLRISMQETQAAHHPLRSPGIRCHSLQGPCTQRGRAEAPPPAPLQQPCCAADSYRPPTAAPAALSTAAAASDLACVPQRYPDDANR